MEPFSAVLLAGGRSRRMGRDKALLRLADGQALWARQLAVLGELRPAEILVSGQRRAEFPASLRVIEDSAPGLGPLAGLVRALESIRAPRLVALAVDLPLMSANFLAHLLAIGAGVAPRVNGRFEPLAAVYPAEVLPLARQHLDSGDRSLQAFLRAAITAGLVEAVDASPQAELFVNWNAPGDHSFQRPA